ncbi:MAG TPA: protein-glutamate O-methyltransferase CheR [Kofleriaceae bacterium]|nr:protein-glutamate O-methyltransferase CheR [Kofleriaceae bacterium]
MSDRFTHPALAAIAARLEADAGLAFPGPRQPMIEARMRRAMTKEGLADPAALLAAIGDASVFERLLDEVTIGETFFFRDAQHYDFVAERVVPGVIARRGPDHALRSWSAGCASGEEAYSLAMVFHDLGLNPGCRVLATDISRAALDQARRGRYRRWSLRGEGAVRARNHLLPDGDCWRVEPVVAARVDFEYLNLVRDRYPGLSTGTWSMDLIFCRNVLIYFGADTVRAVIDKLAASLADGGVLILGPSDPPVYGHDLLEPLAGSPGIYVRRSQWARLVPPPAPRLEPEPPVARPDPPPPVAPAEPGRTDPAAEAAVAIRSLARVDESSALAHCAGAVAQHPLAAELHYLHAVLLAAHGQTSEAQAAARRALYLDPSLVVVHFVLGAALWRSGDTAAARRAFASAARLAEQRPPDELLPLGDGERAGRLGEAARAHVALLTGAAGVRREPS